MYIIAVITAILCGLALIIALVVSLTKTSSDESQFTSPIDSRSTTIEPTASSADNNSSAYGEYRYATVTSDTQTCSSIGVLVHCCQPATSFFSLKYFTKVFLDKYYNNFARVNRLFFLICLEIYSPAYVDQQSMQPLQPSCVWGW